MIIDVSQSPDIAPLHEAVARLLAPGRINKGISEESTETTRMHFRRLANERDRGSRFYEQYGDVTHSESTEQSAFVVIPPVFNKNSRTVQRGNPLALRLYGGDVYPSGTISSVTGRPIQHLSIPANSQAKRMLPGDFDKLVPVFNRQREVVALAMSDAPVNKQRLGAKRARTLKKMVGQARLFGGRVIMFWLTKRAHHEPDSSVIPSENDYRDAVQRALEGMLS